jgi:hypothetical protein
MRRPRCETADARPAPRNFTYLCWEIPYDDGAPLVVLNGRPYAVEWTALGEHGLTALVLTKPDGTGYALRRGPDGSLACNCPGFTARWAGIHGGMCKHLRAADEAAALRLAKKEFPRRRGLRVGPDPAEAFRMQVR